MKTIESFDQFGTLLNLKPYTNAHTIDIEGYRVLSDVQLAVTGEFLKPFRLKNCIFEGFFEIQSNHFKDNVIFEQCTFDRLTISASSFQKNFKMESCVIKKKFNLIDSTFYGKTELFKNDYLGGCNIFEKRDSFGAVEFLGGLILF